jgi:hypothetical protein
MAVITETQLKTSLEATYVSLLNKKCNYLCLGRCPDGLNAEIKKVYAYWSVVGIWDCDMTEDEINCVQSVIKECVFTKAKFDPSLAAPAPSTSQWDLLGVSIQKISGSCSPVTLKANPHGGVAPYTYAWSCVAGQPGCDTCTGVSFDNSAIQQVVLTGAIKLFNGQCADYTKVKVTITDAVGNTTSHTYVASDCT